MMSPDAVALAKLRDLIARQLVVVGAPPFDALPALSTSMATFRCGGPVDLIHYVPDFLSADEEASLLQQLDADSQANASRWHRVRGREIGMFGG